MEKRKDDKGSLSILRVPFIRRTGGWMKKIQKNCQCLIWMKQKIMPSTDSV